jgi:predicted nucleotidyltransferase
MRTRSSGGVRVFSLDRAAIEAALARLVADVYHADARIAAVVLFGSFARGDAVPGSDVDLLIVLGADERRFMDRIPEFLPDSFPVGVDVLPWTLAELEDRVAEGDRFAVTILRDGRILLDRDGAVARLRETPGPR